MVAVIDEGVDDTHIDLDGKISGGESTTWVGQVFDGEISPGAHSFMLDLPVLAAGTYYLCATESKDTLAASSTSTPVVLLE